MKTVTIEYMRAVPKNTLLRLRYDCVNTGEFWWLHDRVEADRVYGAFSYDGEGWEDVCDYLYEFMGDVCRGSGAEPVMLAKRVDMAKDPDRYRAVLGTPARRPKGLQRGQALQLATVLALPKGSRIFFRQAVDGPVQCFEYWHAKGELEDTPYGYLGRAELMTRLEAERVPYDAEYPVGSGVFRQVRPDEPEALRDVPAEAEALRRVLSILEHRGGMAALRALQTVSERLGKRPWRRARLSVSPSANPDSASTRLRVGMPIRR